MPSSACRNWFRPLVVFACVLGLITVVLPGVSAQDKEPRGKIQELLKERLDTLKKIHDQTLQMQQAGAAIPPGAVHQSKLALLNAQIEMAQTKEQRVKLFEELVQELEQWEKLVLKQVADGQVGQVDALQARVRVLEARIALEIAKQEK